MFYLTYMKNLVTTCTFILSLTQISAQCSEVSLVVSTSDTSLIQLYHPGFFLIPSGEANICEWLVTSFEGDIVYQDTTSGLALDQGLVQFEHTVPITDSMHANLVITNPVAGIVCTIDDTLFWDEVEVIPGSIIGNWRILSNNGGIEEQISHTKDGTIHETNFSLFPNPVDDILHINYAGDIHAILIYDLNAHVIDQYKVQHASRQMDVSTLPSGLYIVKIVDHTNQLVGIRKMLKN